MKKTIIFLLFLLNCLTINAQQTRNGVWLFPSKAKKINGLCLTLLPPDLFDEINNPKQVNGINLQPDALSLMMDLMLSVHLLLDKEARGRYFNTYIDSSALENDIFYVNGLNIGISSPTSQLSVKGVNIQGAYTFASELKGLSITPLVSKTINHNGLIISGLCNKSYKGKGVQIALVNDCKDCKGVQLGLINRMGKRIIPFINLRF
jgi:hypothetical protein